MSEYKKAAKMDEKEFWKIIDYAQNVSDGDMDKQVKTITDKLSAYTPEQIVTFEMLLEKKLIEANDFKIMAVDKIIDGSVTDDSFIYFRCWLIGLGQKTFDMTLKNPDYLAGVVDKGVLPDFESLLYVSTQAYKNKTGKTKEDETFPRDIAYKQGLNYDLGGPSPTGKEWQEKELPTLYPKLWNKFN